MTFKIKEFNELTLPELYEILKSRMEVFYIEQEIFYLDMDDIDYKSVHCFITDNGRVGAYLRAFYGEEDKKSVQIGRVLTLKHGGGLGRTLMEKSIPAIKEKMKCEKICLDSQTHAVGFYEKFGFKVKSGEFLEAGVPHVSMELDL